MCHSPQESNTKESFDNSNKVSTIVRAPHSRKYFVMANQSAQDKTLSWGATGMLAYLLSLPDNWKIIKDELVKHKIASRYATRKYFDELVEKKYIYKATLIINNLCRTKYFFFEKPYDLQSSEFKEFISELKKYFPDAEIRNAEIENAEEGTLQSTQEENTQKINTHKKEEEESEVQKTDSSQASESLSANASKASNKFSKIKKYENLEELEKLTNYMISKIRLIDPEFKVSNTKTWLKGFDAILRIDKRKYEDVIALMDYIYENDFWKTNILSPQKLRIQFTRLIAEQAAKCSADKIAFKRKVVFDVLKEMKSSLKENVIINKEFIHNSLTNEKLYFNLQLKDFIAKLERLLNCEITITKHEEETYG